jgi:DNA polymerase III subunit epsilon
MRIPVPDRPSRRIVADSSGFWYDGAMTRIATLDFEASSFGGWPIEVGWMREGDDKPRSMLIQPAPGWSMAEWSEDSGQVHYISPRDLERDGVDVREVVDALEADLAGFTVVSDAPYLDQRWLARLCDAAGCPVPFTIEPAPDVAKVGPVRHRAGPDAEQLLRAIVAARPNQADAEFAAAFLAQKGSIAADVELGIDD